MKVKLKKFRPADMRESGITVFLAMKGSGKTTLLRDFLFHKRHIPSGMVFSATEESNEAFKRIVPPAFVYSEFDVERLESVYKYQGSKIGRYRKQRSAAEKREISDEDLEKIDYWAVWKKKPEIFTVIEDQLYDKAQFNKTIVKALFKNGRHRRMYVLVTAQDIMDVPSSIRGQVDYWVILKEDSVTTREKIFKHVVSGIFKDFKVFNEIMDQCTQDHRCLVIDKRSPSSAIVDSVSWYRADKDLPPFRVGCRRFWQFSQLNYVDEQKEMSAAELEVRARLGLVTPPLDAIGSKRRRGGADTLAGLLAPLAKVPKIVGGAAAPESSAARSNHLVSVVLEGDNDHDDDGV